MPKMMATVAAGRPNMLQPPHCDVGRLTGCQNSGCWSGAYSVLSVSSQPSQICLGGQGGKQMSAGSGEGADARASGQSASQPDCRVEEAGEHLITLGRGQGLGHMLTVVEQDDDLIGQAPIAEVGDLAAVRSDSGELGQCRRDGLTTGALRSRRPIETVFGLRLLADLVELARVQSDDAHAQTSD